jgi:exodeoxyribonuclease-3
MKLISWNVNGIRAVERKGDLAAFLEKHDPDIFLIQETKAKPEQLAAIIKKYSEYEQFYHSAGKAGYAGTAIWVKKNFKLQTSNYKFQTGMPGFDDDEGRISRISFDDTEVLGVYFPNGGKSPDAWNGKLEFYEKFLAFVNQLRADGKTVLFAGDVNCAHEEIDLARPKDNEGKIGFHPDERAWLSKWIQNGWKDLWRDQNLNVRNVYSWWHVITRSRANNVGWRIDYFFVEEKFVPQVKDVQYLTEQMGSDHCPVLLTY